MDVHFIIKEVLLIIRRYLSDDYKVYLFGSWPTGTALPTSDVDIGILKSAIPIENERDIHIVQ